MTVLEHDTDIDYTVDRPIPGVLLIRRLLAIWRDHRRDRQRRAVLRHLSDATLIDIGIDPRTVRYDFPRVATDTGFFVPGAVR